MKARYRQEERGKRLPPYPEGIGYNDIDVYKEGTEIAGHTMDLPFLYQALEKYGRNLTQLAARGKLDPVMGRDEEIRRVIQREVENRIARGILDGTIRDGDTVEIDAKDGKLVMVPMREQQGTHTPERERSRGEEGGG